MSLKWFGSKTLFRVEMIRENGEKSASFLIEERITLVRAVDFDAALRAAEEAARAYADQGQWLNSSGHVVRTRYLEFCDVFALEQDELGPGSEVYSQVLYLNRDIGNRAIVDRFAGTPDECSPELSAIFEPDLKRSAESC